MKLKSISIWLFCLFFASAAIVSTHAQSMEIGYNGIAQLAVNNYVPDDNCSPEKKLHRVDCDADCLMMVACSSVSANIIGSFSYINSVHELSNIVFTTRTNGLHLDDPSELPQRPPQI